MNKLKNLITIIFLLTIILLAGCSNKKESSKIFRYNEAQGIENLDPVMSSNYPAIWPLNQCCEGLLEFNKDMNLAPLLAASYEISSDGLKYTFYIHKNIYFHDDDCFPDKKGRLLTSNDFKYCFERVCDPRTKTRGAWLFRDRIKGATEYINRIQRNSPQGSGTSSNEKKSEVDNKNNVTSKNDTTKFSDVKLKEQWYGKEDMVYAFDLPDGRHGYTRDKNVFHVYNDSTNTYTDYYADEDVLPLNPQTSTDANHISGIQCPNDTTLVIVLEKPFAPFLSILTMPYAFVYPHEAVEYYKENFGYHPVGTGPFKFVKWDFDKELVFEKNPNYWKKNNPPVYLEGFNVTFTRSVETEFLDFKDGKLDYHSPSPEILSQILDDNGKLLPQYDFELVKQPWLNTVYLAIQLDKDMPGGKDNPLSNNKKLRQAINYAIDREKIVKYVLKFKGYPAENGPIPKGMPGYDSNIIGYRYNKDKATKLLEEAGYPNGKGLSLKLTISNEETQKMIGEAVQAQLKDVGIDVQLEFIQGSTLRSAQVGGELAFWRANWGADYFDPENFMALFYSENKTPNGPNYTHYSNPAVDSLYELGIKETDFNKRKELYNNAEKIIIDDSPWIFLLYNEIIYLRSKRIKDMYIDGLNTLVLKYTKVE